MQATRQKLLSKNVLHMTLMCDENEHVSLTTSTTTKTTTIPTSGTTTNNKVSGRLAAPEMEKRGTAKTAQPIA